MEERGWMSWRTLCFYVMIIAVVFLGLNVLINRNTASLRTLETSLNVTLSGLQADTSSLKAEIKEIGSDTYIETMARRNYGFVNEGELRFEFTNPEALETLTDSEYAILKKELSK